MKRKWHCGRPGASSCGQSGEPVKLRRARFSWGCNARQLLARRWFALASPAVVAALFSMSVSKLPILAGRLLVVPCMRVFQRSYFVSCRLFRHTICRWGLGKCFQCSWPLKTSWKKGKTKEKVRAKVSTPKHFVGALNSKAWMFNRMSEIHAHLPPRVLKELPPLDAWWGPATLFSKS